MIGDHGGHPESPGQDSSRVRGSRSEGTARRFSTLSKAQRLCVLAAWAHDSMRRTESWATVDPKAPNGADGRAFRAITVNTLVRDKVLEPTEYYGQFRLTEPAQPRAAALRDRRAARAARAAIVPDAAPR